MKQDFRQVLELTNTGFLKYSLIKVNFNEDKNTVVFATSQKVSDEIKVNEVLTDETKINIFNFIKKIANTLNTMVKMKRIEPIQKLTLVVPTELTILSLDTYDCSSLDSYDSASLTRFLKNKKTKINGYKQIASENAVLIVDEQRYSFNETRRPIQANNGKLEVLNCYAIEDYVNFIGSKVVEQFKTRLSVVSKGYVIKKELVLNSNFDLSNQSKIIFDWADDFTWIEVTSGNDIRRFKILTGINAIANEVNKILELNGNLNRNLISNAYLKTVNLASTKKLSNWFRTKNRFNKISEISNVVLRQAISKAINVVMANLVEDLKQRFEIRDASDAQKYHFGELTKIKGIKEYYKTTSFDRGYNQYVVADEFENKFNGNFAESYHNAFVLVENEKQRYLNDVEKLKSTNQQMIYNKPVFQQPNVSFYKAKQQFIKKEKVNK